MKLRGTHHLTLTVTDLDTTVGWYESVLGFQEVIRYHNDLIGAHCGVLEHPGAPRPTIGLRHYDVQHDTRFDERRIGLDHLAFDVGDEGTLDQWLAHLKTVGVTFSVTRLPELSITAFRDPDNIQIELCAANPSPPRSAIDDTGRFMFPLDDA